MGTPAEDKEEILQLLDQYEEPPINVVKLAKTLGVEVYKITSGWDKRISGLIEKNDEDGGASGYAIYSNGEHSIGRRRFTIAHELAHYVLHRNLIGDGIVEDALYRSGLASVLETEANKFAAEILIPNRLLRKAVERERSITKLAEMFKVSSEAMTIRLLNSREAAITTRRFAS